MKKLIVVMLAVVLALSLVPQAGWADSTPVVTERTEMQKLDFGVRNTFLGWTELFRRPYHGFRDGGFMGSLEGLGTGLVYGIADTVGGVLHIVTFPFPKIDVPLPEGGVKV